MSNIQKRFIEKDGQKLWSFFKYDGDEVKIISLSSHVETGYLFLDYHSSAGIKFYPVTSIQADIIANHKNLDEVFDFCEKTLFRIPPSENTDTKSESAITHDSVGVVESEGEALPNDNDKDVCKTCGYTFTDYCPCSCDTCADCGVITKLVGSHTQCPECYQRSKTPNLLETDVKLTESEIDALLILVNTELDADDRIFELSELNAIRNKLLKASENFDLPFLLW